jgi:hypothetical protein
VLGPGPAVGTVAGSVAVVPLDATVVLVVVGFGVGTGPPDGVVLGGLSHSGCKEKVAPFICECRCLVSRVVVTRVLDDIRCPQLQRTPFCPEDGGKVCLRNF